MVVTGPSGLPPGSQVYTGSTSTTQQTSGTSGTEQNNGNAAVVEASSNTHETNWLQGLLSFFGFSSTPEAPFEPIDQRVSDATAVGANTNAAATSSGFEELRSRLQPNSRVNYLEIERSDVNRGLSEFLSNFKTQLDQNPQLSAQLAQTQAGQALLSALQNAANGDIDTNDILNIQKFIVASGVDITYPGSNSTGIDGQFGPKTLEGLQAALTKMQTGFSGTPEQTAAYTQSLNDGMTRANQGVQDLESSYDGGQMDRYTRGTPGASNPDALQPASTTSVVNRESTDFGRDLVRGARQAANDLRSVGKCMKGVRMAFDNIGLPLRNPDGSNIVSAYQAANILARPPYSDRFSELVPATKEDLRNLPAGAVIVWDRNPDPAKRAANPNNGFTHGHIAVATGDGYEISDHVQAMTMNTNGRYGGFRVFLPKTPGEQPAAQ